MKKLIFYLSVGFFLSFLTSCDFFEDFVDGSNDEYSMENTWISYGLIHKDAAAGTITLMLDNGDIVHPVGNPSWVSNVNDNQRVIANFTIVGEKTELTGGAEEYDVRVNSLRNVLYKGIFNITPATEDSIGNDPIHVKDQWVKNNMLNFELQYRGGSTMHYINLVKKSEATATEPLILELRHNDNNDPDAYRLSAVVTFDLSSLKVTGKDSVSFRVVAKDYNGSDYGYNGVYKY